jgi:hypothetical protein
VADWKPLREATFVKRPLPAWRRCIHAALRIRGLFDAIMVAIRDPDVFLLQVALWRNSGLRGLYQFRRLRELSSLLAGRDATVLELGSGASTFLIAKRAKDAVSVEESQVWATKLGDALRAAWYVPRELRERTVRQIIVRPRYERFDDGDQWVCGYDLEPAIRDRHWDVLYVDGPTNWPQGERCLASGTLTLPNADLFSLSRLPTEVWVDGRLDTLRYFAQNLDPHWRVRTEMDLPRSSRRLFHTVFIAEADTK